MFIIRDSVFCDQECVVDGNETRVNATKYILLSICFRKLGKAIRVTRLSTLCSTSVIEKHSDWPVQDMGSLFFYGNTNYKGWQLALLKYRLIIKIFTFIQKFSIISSTWFFFNILIRIWNLVTTKSIVVVVYKIVIKFQSGCSMPSYLRST